jgi:hypothetical protein
MATGENLTGHWSPRDKEPCLPVLCAKSESLVSLFIRRKADSFQGGAGLPNAPETLIHARLLAVNGLQHDLGGERHRHGEQNAGDAK